MESISEILEKNSSDPRIRLQVGQELLDAFSEQNLPSNSTVLTQFVDVMVQWLNGSNYKVALLALEILEVSMGLSGDLLAPYMLDNCTALMERLGDQKEQVRDQAEDLIIKFMSVPHSAPQLVFERILNGFSHKQWLVRMGLCQVLVKTLDSFGSECVQLSKMTPLVCKLVSDPNSQVREAASDTLEKMYLYTGDKLESDIWHRRLLPETKAQAIFGKFSEAKQRGLVGADGRPLPDRTVPDCAVLEFKTPSRATVPQTPTTGISNRGRISGRTPTQTGDTRGNSTQSKMASAVSKRSTSVPANKARPLPTPSTRQGKDEKGAVTEETFRAAFENCPKVQFFSGKDLSALMQKSVDILSNTNNEWDKRVDELKKLRSLVIHGATDYDEEFYSGLKLMEAPLDISVKDLRSQVVREACITVAFLAENLGMKLESVVLSVFQSLVNLLQRSAKIMSTSGFMACKFVLRNVKSTKLVPIVTTCMDSKSNEIRRASCEFIHLMFIDWQTHMFEKNVQGLQEALRRGLNDADPEARTHSRKAFHSFAEHFPGQSELLYKSLDARTQKLLHNGDLSHASSSGSIAGAHKKSQENVSRYGMPPRGGGYNLGGRSTSEIDAGAARRAKEVHSSGYGRQRPTTYQMNSTLRRPPRLNAIPGTPGNDNRSGRTQTRPSMSQPGSRSGSPSSRLPMSVARKTPRATYNPRSRGGSREQSPNRGYNGRRFSNDAGASSPGVSSKYLAHSRDMERAVYDALSRRTSSRDDPDASETSSVCSERSLTRHESAELTNALRLCVSTQPSERKEGLATLQKYFKAGFVFSGSELKRICESFTGMFVDPHNKTFTVFLDTLVEFLARYRGDVCDWLYVLLTRLLMKMGADLLPSTATKVHKTLEVVRASFPYEIQYQTLIRYIMDPTQTPSVKVKATMLNYMVDLVHNMESDCFVLNEDTRQAVCKVVHWTMEPKSLDVQKASKNVIVSLFNLNPSEFRLMLDTFPKSYQETVYRLITQYMNMKGGSNQSYGGASYGRNSLSPKLNGREDAYLDMENVHDKLRETSAQIQDCFSRGADTRGKGSQDSGIVDTSETPFGKLDDGLNGKVMETLGLASDLDRQEMAISDILQEMSNHNKRVQERLRSMENLKYMTRDGSFTLWDKHFKTILFIILETLADKDPKIRQEALKLMKELCFCQAPRFRDYAELTLLRILEAHKDSEKEVVKAAEECSVVMATHLPPHLCVRMLVPIIQSDKPPTLQAAIKILTKVVVDQLSEKEVEEILPDIMPGITEAFNNEDSSVRKNSVLCLVAVHNSVGMDKMEPFLSSLKSTKIKLLNMYIRKEQQ